jgi:hypothetical protein
VGKRAGFEIPGAKAVFKSVQFRVEQLSADQAA